MNDSTESQNPAFAQASGYATVWHRPMCGECPLFFIRESDLSAGDMFAWCRLHRDRRHHECPACVDMDAHLAEVRRLRASVSLRDAALERVNLLTTGNGVNANPYETIVEAHAASNDALTHNHIDIRQMSDNPAGNEKPTGGEAAE